MSGGSNNVPTIDKKYLSSSEVPEGTRVEAYYDFNVSDHDNYYIDPGTGDIVKYDGKHKVFETFNSIIFLVCISSIFGIKAFLHISSELFHFR